MNIRIDAHLRPSDHITSGLVSNPLVAIGEDRINPDLNIWLGRSDLEAVGIIDRLVSTLIDIRTSCLQRLAESGPQKVEHSRPFHLTFQEGCPACVVERTETPAS